MMPTRYIVNDINCIKKKKLNFSKYKYTNTFIIKRKEIENTITVLLINKYWVSNSIVN